MGVSHPVLECVINVSEADGGFARLGRFVRRLDDVLLDTHTDAHHNRTVLTLAGPKVEVAAFAIATAAVDHIDLSRHQGVHPRLGAVDVVPFVPLAGSTMDDALAARDRFAHRIAEELGVPCFLYGPERTLPEIRRRAFNPLQPDVGPSVPHPTAGACCVGARDVLVAYNLWISGSVENARRIASAIRSPSLRTLGLDVGGHAQVSCNLVRPTELGPGEAFDLVAAHAEIVRAELVGLLPRAVLANIAPHRWELLDVDESKTIEARLAKTGPDQNSV